MTEQAVDKTPYIVVNKLTDKVVLDQQDVNRYAKQKNLTPKQVAELAARSGNSSAKANNRRDEFEAVKA